MPTRLVSNGLSGPGAIARALSSALDLRKVLPEIEEKASRPRPERTTWATLRNWKLFRDRSGSRSNRARRITTAGWGTSPSPKVARIARIVESELELQTALSREGPKAAYYY
ncbi:hypothetical protein U1Q18_041076 [Sarracenia purpurea var. burkii]